MFNPAEDTANVKPFIHSFYLVDDQINSGQDNAVTRQVFMIRNSVFRVLSPGLLVNSTNGEESNMVMSSGVSTSDYLKEILNLMSLFFRSE